jgi:hypothetical protein
VCQMCSPSHYPWLDVPNVTWRWVQVMKFLTVQLPQFSCYFIRLQSKYSP